MLSVTEINHFYYLYNFTDSIASTVGFRQSYVDGFIKESI